MSRDRCSVCVSLSPAQVDEVVRSAMGSRAPTLSTLISNLLAAAHGSADASGEAPSQQRLPVTRETPAAERSRPRLSRSLLRGLSLLTCFQPDGRERGIVELAGELGMSASTAHRYAVTLVALGLLERCPESRKYRLPGT